MEGMYRAWGSKVAKKRAQMKHSQEQLALMTGLTQGTISRIESGVQVPSDRVKWLVAGALHSTLDELFPWPPTAPPMPEVDVALTGNAA